MASIQPSFMQESQLSPHLSLTGASLRSSDKGEKKCHYFDLLFLKKICEKSYLNWDMETMVSSFIRLFWGADGSGRFMVCDHFSLWEAIGDAH